jgi:hypothetical protein
MQDQIIQTKTCAITGKEFSITQGDLDFYAKISPTFAGQKFVIPTPTLCPEERQRRRLAFRNERNLYRRTCDASGKQIISIYSPVKPYKVYDQKIRRSDARDPMDYGRDFDFSKTFTENFRELMGVVPRISLYSNNNENADYTNHCDGVKNWYLSVDVADGLNIFYSQRIISCQDLTDSYRINQSSNCYESMFINNSQKCFYSLYCFNSSNLYWCTDCVNCHFCIGCVWLENQKYYVDNVFVGADAYYNAVTQLDWKKLKRIKWQRYLIISSENSLWINITNSKNIRESGDINDSIDLSYCNECWWLINSYDTYETFTWNYLYEIHGCNRTNQSMFWHISYDCSLSFYIDSCHNSSNLFGCVWLRNKSYCIFNKQYTKEEYETTVAKIISHMQSTEERGEFFHPSLSPFGYNETVAQEYYSAHQVGTQFFSSYIKTDQNLSLQEFWYHRSDYQAPSPVSDKVIQWKDLPTTITEVQDDILQYAIACEVTGKLFRLQPQELAFYRKHNIPLPRKHPDQRHLERLQLRK